MEQMVDYDEEQDDQVELQPIEDQQLPDDQSTTITKGQLREMQQNLSSQDPTFQTFYDENAERNPRMYAYMPSQYTKKIVPAGRLTYKSEAISSVIFGR